MSVTDETAQEIHPVSAVRQTSTGRIAVILANILIFMWCAGQAMPEKAVADDEEPPYWEVEAERRAEVRRNNLDAVGDSYERRMARYGDDADKLILPGLLADRKKQLVTVQAEATGLTGNEPVEFFLIAEASGHDYEAIAVSLAKPSDIHKALEFIGMEAGRPVEPEARHFWPRGERVIMTFRWEDEGNAVREFRAEDLTKDLKIGDSMPQSGLVFVGSQWIKDKAAGEKIYAAESPMGPQAIASNYNEPTTIFDVPRLAAQSEVYERYIPYPGRQPQSGILLDVILEPEFKDGHERVINLTLTVKPVGDVAADDIADLRFRLMDHRNEPVHDGDGLQHVLSAFERFITNRHDPFVTVIPHRNLTLGTVKSLYEFMRGLESEDGIRMEPQPEEHLYYKAFLPDTRFRARETRPSQPLELHLEKDDEGRRMSGILKEISRVRDEDEPHVHFHTTEYPVDSPDNLEKSAGEIAHRIPVMLIFAKSDVRYGDVLDFIDQIRELHPIMYIFLH